MPKNNKVTERSFSNIAETDGRKGSYEKFLNVDQDMGLQESDLLKQLKEKYREIARDCVDDIRMLAALEEIIIQIRSKEVIDSELRLSLSRNYIYARTMFYRRGKEINDIRVVVGKVNDPQYPEFNRGLDILLADPEFRFLCKEKLTEVMNKEIEKNINQLNYVYNEKTI